MSYISGKEKSKTGKEWMVIHNQSNTTQSLTRLGKHHNILSCAYAKGMKVNRTTVTTESNVQPPMYLDTKDPKVNFPRPSSIKFWAVMSPSRCSYNLWYTQYPICFPFPPHQTRTKSLLSRPFVCDANAWPAHCLRVSIFTPLRSTSPNSL